MAYLPGPEADQSLHCHPALHLATAAGHYNLQQCMRKWSLEGSMLAYSAILHIALLNANSAIQDPHVMLYADL
eukprot:1161854-Pelagomonas_calceolata.AAC.2